MRGLKITIGVIVALVALGGVALLAWPAAARAQTPAPSAPADFGGLDSGRPDFHGRGGFGHGPGGSIGHLLVEATAALTGQTEPAVAAALQAGQSLAQIAQGKGKTAQAVIEAARTQLADQLAQAVTAGRLTQAQADAELGQFDQTAEQVVNDGTLGAHRPNHPRRHPHPFAPGEPGNTSSPQRGRRGPGA